MRNLTHAVTMKLSETQRRELEERARECGLKPGPFARRELLRSLELPRETRLILSELIRAREIMMRVFELVAVDAPLTFAKLRMVEADVLAVNLAPIVAAMVRADGSVAKGVSAQ